MTTETPSHFLRRENPSILSPKHRSIYNAMIQNYSDNTFWQDCQTATKASLRNKPPCYDMHWQVYCPVFWHSCILYPPKIYHFSSHLRFLHWCSTDRETVNSVGQWSGIFKQSVTFSLFFEFLDSSGMTMVYGEWRPKNDQAHGKNKDSNSSNLYYQFNGIVNVNVSVFSTK